MAALIWVKSSYSGGSGGNCVEIATLPGGDRAVRDSKDPEGPVLRFTADEWRVFIRSVKATGPGN
jgi:Domain of unknown function (DUF397)